MQTVTAVSKFWRELMGCNWGRQTNFRFAVSFSARIVLQRVECEKPVDISEINQQCPLFMLKCTQCTETESSVKLSLFSQVRDG